MRTTRVLLLILMVCLVPPVWGQAPAPPARGGRTDRPITLDVVVTDKSGNPVSGLQQSDFTVLDDKQAQTILAFRAVDETSKGPPLQVIFLLDAVNPSYRAVSNARQQLEKFLRQGDGPLLGDAANDEIAASATRPPGERQIATALRAHRGVRRVIGEDAKQNRRA